MFGLGIIIALYLYIRFAIWVTRKLAGERESKPLKWSIRVTVVIMFALIPTWDTILGHIYLNHLCNTEAGVKVYQTVELPAQYWDEKGKPRFYVNRYGHNNLRFIFPDKGMIDAPQFEYTWVTTTYSKFFFIDKDILQIADRKKGQILGQYSLLRYWGGWFARNFTPHNSAVACEAKDLNSWESNIFKPATSFN